MEFQRRVKRIDTITEKNINEDLRENLKKSLLPTRQILDDAERVDFKSSPEEVTITDQYGFEKRKTIMIKDLSLITEDDKRKYNYQVDQWYSTYQKICDKSNSKFQEDKNLKNETRNGIPDCLRGIFWEKYAEIDKYYKPGLYQSLLNDKDMTDSEKDSENIIFKDLSRTFPSNSLFNTRYGLGQRSMYNVLYSFAKYNNRTGYVQGMAFICALLLIYMVPEKAFYTFISLMKKYELEGFYLTGFPKLKNCSYCLAIFIKKLMPEVFSVIKENGIYISMFAAEWFMTLFTRDLEFKVLVRIFDCFFLEGFKVIYRVSLAFLKLKEREIIDKREDPANTINTLKNIYVDIDVDDLFKEAFKLKLTRKEIEKYEQEFENVKDDPNNEIVQML